MQTNEKSHVVKKTKQLKRKTTKQGKLINQYLKIRNIGQGPYSKIKLMKNVETNQYFAMKKYNLFILKKKTRMERLQNGTTSYVPITNDVRGEIQIMQSLNHQNVIKLYQILEDQQEEKIYLIMDYCEYGDLAEWNHKISKYEISKHVKPTFQFFKIVFIQVARGLTYLHQKNIVHRDIKPQNILINKQNIPKFIDFGRSAQLKSPTDKLKGSQGTYHFMAPQMLSQIYPDGYDGKKCDIWSLGVSFFGILFEVLPFYTEPLIRLFQKIQKVQYEFPVKCQTYARPFIPLIKMMIAQSPQKRPTASELINLLQKLEE